MGTNKLYKLGQPFNIIQARSLLNIINYDILVFNELGERNCLSNLLTFSLKIYDQTARYNLYKQSKKQLAEASTRSRSHIYGSINWLAFSNFLNLENIELEQYKVLVSRFFKTNYDIVPALFFF